MFLNNTVHYICEFLSAFVLPVLMLAAIALFCASLYDLAALGMSRQGGIFAELSLPTLISFADPWHVFMGSGATIFILIVFPGLGAD